jgi:DNA replication regulator DPB11
MEQTAIENGAEFRTDLTKSVTHLVARNGEGEKYKYATQWNVTVVTLKWFTDCLERGMILDANPYHPMVPLEKQGAGAWVRPLVAAKGQSGSERTATVELSSNPRPRKLRRTASTKLVGQNEGIWGDIVGTGFATHQVKGVQNGQQQGRDPTSSRSVPVIQAATSFASETTFSGAVEAPQPPPETKTTTSAEGFLQGSYFLISGFSSKQVCDQTLMATAAANIPRRVSCAIIFNSTALSW